MSTRIYNGRILRNCTLAEALDKLQRMRNHAVKKAQEGVAVEIAKLQWYWADMDQNYLPIPRKDFRKAYWRTLEILRKEKSKVLVDGIRSVDWDLTFEVLLIPDGNHVLALYYIENDPGFLDLLDEAGFEDFHYQNATDGPDHILPEEWSERKRTWTRALKTGVPGDVGLKYHLVNWDDITTVLHNRDMITSAKPDENTRRMMVASNLIDPEFEKHTQGVKSISRRAKIADALAMERAPHVFLTDDV